MHIHSNHSSDGKQLLVEIINETKKYNFEIISITDHDSVSVYDELYKLLTHNKLPKDAPIIIPGIEYTVSFKQYKTMCHILKYFINPKSKRIIQDIKNLNKAYLRRTKMQISRINQSKMYQELFAKYNIKVSYKSFLKYLRKDNKKPDYAPLIDFLANIFKKKQIKTSEIYELVKYYNNDDACKERRELKQQRFEYLDGKYSGIDIQDNRRFLLSILAVRGVDDAYYSEYPISGSLSVDECGQLSIYNLNQEGVTVFAHPEHDKLHLINGVKSCGGGFSALELNFKSKKEFFNEVAATAKQEGLSITKGSDRHGVNEPVYEDLSFYSTDLKTIEVINNLKGKKHGKI